MRLCVVVLMIALAGCASRSRPHVYTTIEFADQHARCWQWILVLNEAGQQIKAWKLRQVECFDWWPIKTLQDVAVKAK